MAADNRDALAQLETLHRNRVAAAEARAETQLAVAQAREETAAQDELAAALETLAAKRQRSADLEAQAVETRVAVARKRFELLSARLASIDPSEQLAAFEAAMSSDDESLRRLALQTAFRSASDDLRGAALAVHVAGMPQMSIAVAYDSGNDKAATYVQVLRITEVSGASFAGEFITPSERKKATAAGTIQGATLSLNAQWESGEKCLWRARLDEQGVLGGQMTCATAGGGHDRENPGGTASVSF